MNKNLIVLLIFDLLFAGTGAMLVGLAMRAKTERDRGPTLSNVAENLLLIHAPWKAGFANGALIFVTFAVSLPALALQTNRAWVKAFGWLTIVCAMVTLSLGINIWFSTLKTRSNLRHLWTVESPQMQSLLQQRFNCCGYLDAATPPFQRDATCPNALVAAQKPGCVGAFSDFANGFLDAVFTAVFGMVALDTVILLSVAVLLKDRLDQARFRMSDMKHGPRSI